MLLLEVGGNFFMNTKYNFEEIVKNFKFEGKLVESNNNPSGHINDTYILECKRDDASIIKYVLQRINLDIFGDPDNLMQNIVSVTKHIIEKVKSEGGNPLRETLNVIETLDGKNYYKNEEGLCFRAFHFIDNAKTYQMVEEPKHMYTTGRALGKFQKQLNDFSADELHETIPDFHNTAKRYKTFLKAVENNKSGRVKEVEAEIQYIKDRAAEMSLLVDMLDRGQLPLRVTHNDTKFNNIMIDINTGEGVALVDLDTVMPGLSLYDFGDAVRSGATTALEDEIDLSKVSFDMNLFEEFTKGYLEEMKESLVLNEIDALALSAKIITLELAMRFLTDHIDGDIYFKVHRENHNLDRARNQLKLANDIENNMDCMKKIVQKYNK